MNRPLVSIIIPTKNSGQVLEACLLSIKKQTCEAIEIVVVDNNSTDNTLEIAEHYTDKVFTKGPERSAQRNYGVEKAKGHYITIVDSDMKLSPNVIEECVKLVSQHPETKGIIIPEESFGEGFWARCKKLERSFYVGVDWIEAARFFEKETYQKLGGYDESMISGEDWDLSQRVAKEGKLGRIQAFIYHNEGRLSLGKTLGKKYYYAKQFSAYQVKNKEEENVASQTGIVSRYKLFFSKPKELFKNPLVGVGMLFMKTAEFGVGGVGLLMGKLK